MRITYLHQYFNTPDMPGGTRSYEMARRLVSMGHEVNMITSWREPDDHRKTWFQTEEAGIKVHWLPVPYSNEMSYPERIRAFFRFAIGAARNAASLPTDIVFATSTPLTIALPGVYAARKQDVPMVFEVRDLWPEVPIVMGALRSPLTKSAAWKLRDFAYGNSFSIVALSEKIRLSVLKWGFAEELTFMIPNGSDLDFFAANNQTRNDARSNLGILEGEILIVYTGTLGIVNGVDYVVRLASILRKDDRFKFLIVGDGVESGKLQTLAQNLGCTNNNLRFEGKVAKKQVPYYLAAADISISTVRPDPLLEADSANKVFDALAAGRCVALNHGGWLADLLEEERAGIRLDQNPVQAASQLIAYTNKTEFDKRGKHARILAEKRFSRDQLAAELEQVLLKAIDAYK